MFNRVKNLYYKFFLTHEEYAKKIGVNVGDSCFICARFWGSEPYLISIGSHVQITDGVTFHTHGGGHVVRKYIPDFDVFGKIVIEDWAYVGAWSHIMPGVTIGKGSIVAAGSIVTKSVPPGTVVGGNPAKYISTVEEYIKRNESYNLHCKSLSKEEKKALLISLPEERFIRKPFMSKQADNKNG